MKDANNMDPNAKSKSKKKRDHNDFKDEESRDANHDVYNSKKGNSKRRKS